MYIAMNRFRVVEGRESDFEGMWAKRETFLEGVPGFEAFHLLRGPTANGVTLYASHSTWSTRETFDQWTQSEAFRKAHADARSPEGTLAGPPVFEGFDVVL